MLLPLARLLRLPNVFTALADIGLGLCATAALSPAALNDDFAYFTHATLDFANSAQSGPPIEPGQYLATVCEGVSRHLMRRAERPRRVPPRAHQESQ